MAERTPGQDGTRRRRRWWLIGTAAAATLVIGGLVGLATATWLWRDSLVAGQRLLPGTMIAGTDVSGGTLADAEQAAFAAGEALLSRSVALTHDGTEWRVTPAELGATHDAAAVVAAAWEATTTASWLELVSVRWLGDTARFDRDVAATVPEEATTALVRDLASRIDRERRDARATWRAGELELHEARAGRTVDVADAAAAVHAALEGSGDEVALPVTEQPPAVTATMLEGVWPGVVTAVDAALDHTVTVVLGDAEWTVRPRELGAVPDPQPVIEGALAASGTVQPAAWPTTGNAEVPLRLPQHALDDFIADIAEDVDRAPRNAAIDYSSGWVELEAERAGRAVDRLAANEQLQAALRGEHEVVELPVETLAPQVTLEDYEHVLLVRQGERRLYHYTDGEIAREWPVAIGASGSATPTGKFTVGAKRHSPTWYNPAPDGWGADMPRIVGPGPTNPLGLRALNWERDGHDTLIRFHGTSQTSSIGRAASRGCVRLTNPDVVDLYDRVPSGATIVSVRG